MDTKSTVVALRRTAMLQDTIRVMQEKLTYKIISKINPTAPVNLRVVDHGLPPNWLAWVHKVHSLPELNRDPNRQIPHEVEVIDDRHIEINAVSAIGSRPSGGLLIYHAPQDLTKASASWKVYSKVNGPLVFELNTGDLGGLNITSLGVITRTTSLAQAALLTFTDGWHTLDITYPDGRVVRYDEGPLTVHA